MRINELIAERQDLDEINMAQVGGAIGKGATAVGKGIGAVGSGAVQAGKNFWSGLKQGWQAGQKAVAGDTNGDGTPDAGTAPVAGGTGGGSAPAGGTGGGAPVAAPAAQTTGGTPVAAPQAQDQGAAPDELEQIKGLVAKLNPDQKKQVAAELEKQSEPQPSTQQTTAQSTQAQPQAGTSTQTTTAQTQPQAGTTPQTTAQTPAAPGGQQGSGKLTADQIAAKKAEIKGKRAAGKSVATSTGGGFSNYVQSGGGSTMVGADAQGNPVFKQNVQREHVAEGIYFSKFLGAYI